MEYIAKKTRILLLNYEFPPLGGGAGPVSFEIAKNLASSGEICIDVVTMGFKGLPQYEELSSCLKVYRVKCLRSKKEICHPWEQATYLFSAFFKCWELLRKNKYHINYTHFIIPTGALSLLLKWFFGLDYVITSHGSDVIGYNKRFKFLYPLLFIPWKIIINGAKRISTPSNYLRTRILEVYKNLSPDKIIVIPNGVEEGKFIPMKKEKYILLVSRLFDNKGIQDFLSAIKDLDLGEWKVKIVGEGPYKEKLLAMVKLYNLSDKVEFLGWLDNSSRQMKDLYGHASIFVLASHFENFNVTLMEALQAGCRVIASDVGGNKEILTETGNLYHSEDIPMLTSLIKKSISEENHPIADSSRFHWKNIIRRYFELLL